MSGHPTLASRQAALSLHFVVVGGGLSGLASAIALTRVGHKVTVLEQQETFEYSPGGLRIPPNQTKILAHWGLKRELSKLGLDSRALLFLRYDDGSILGNHIWDEEVLRECGGDWLLVHFADFHRFLLECAEANGVNLRFGARVVGIDEEEDATVVLANGEHVRGDIIIGCDGADGLLRKATFDRNERVRGNGLAMYSAIIPIEAMKADPELASLLQSGENYAPITAWFGNDHAALGYPMGGTLEYVLYAYVPNPDARIGPSTAWDKTRLSQDAFRKVLGKQYEGRLKKLVDLVRPGSITGIALQEHEDLEDWVHDSANMILLGDAAHPSVPGMIQSSAMAVEDAAVFAKLFSHVKRRDQIPQLMGAYCSLRHSRAQEVLASEMANVRFMTLPDDDPVAQGRDAAFRERHAQGLNVLGGGGNGDDAAAEQWEQIRDTWAYDAEDEADNWWVAWGATAERAYVVASPAGETFVNDFAAGFATAIQMSTVIEA